MFEYKGGDVRLCPIIFHLPFGLLLVMRRAVPLPENHFRDLKTFSRTQLLFKTVRVNITDTDFIKPDTYGFLNNNLVVVDYAGCDTKLEGVTTVKHVEFRADKWGQW